MWITEVRPAWNVAPGEPGEGVWVPGFVGNPAPALSSFPTEPEARTFARVLEQIMYVNQLDGIGWREFRVREI